VKVDAPFTVDIDSEQIGGPSAGLAFTLEVLDRLTAGDLTGGHRIAATGTIELDGTVGRVGGVRQKTASVLAGGYDLFLVPKAEEQEARARAGSKLKVVGVATLDDALQALASFGGNGLALGTLKVD
jgi:PDZ domain-containing protein